MITTHRQRDGRTVHSRGHPEGPVARPVRDGRRGRRRIRLAAVVLAGTVVPLVLDLAPATVTADTPEPHAPTVTTPAPMVGTGCGFLTYRTRRARVWTNHVRGLTDLTCREARWVWRRRPAWRDDLPYRITWSAGAVRVPNPAIATATSASSTRRYCKVTTTTKYRDWPFGNTLLSMRMEQTFGYDDTRVYPGQVLLFPDTTANGFRWHFAGIVLEQDFYSSGTNRQHTSERWSNFTSTGILGLGSVTTTLYTKIWKQANGDWATSHDEGLADCQDDD